MDDDITANTRLYTDIQGLKQLRYNKNQESVKKEVGQQFESLMMQMVLRSMRDATKSFSSGLFGTNQMELYQEMFDNQLSLVMSNADLGFAKIVENSIDQLSRPKPEYSHFASVTPGDAKKSKLSLPESIVEKHESASSLKEFQNPAEFIKKLWSTAKQAASYIGAPPEILLAQAALETNWGKNILAKQDGSSTYNLFNIKADTNWAERTTTMNTLEQKEGVLIKEKSKFKNYHSFTDSFMDYVHLLTKNGRYTNALSKASDPKQFINALHQAGYATDAHYADKVWQIFSSSTFKNLIKNIKGI
jgi:flagellar protein FlgJ